ncbi:MAG: carboxypeptidase-like regulatory domain-containing protein, partial [Pyrinomonadaceae bacterium]
MRAIIPAIILFFTVCTWSQTNSGVISGQILDTAGAVVPGAQVMLEINGKIIARATSDGEGDYKFTNIASGEYSLTVKYITPRLFRKNVLLTGRESRGVNFVLSFEPCSGDSDNRKAPIITEQDRVEIIRALVDLSFGAKTYYFDPEKMDIRWLMPEQKAKLVIRSREQLQEITEKDGPIEY